MSAVLEAVPSPAAGRRILRVHRPAGATLPKPAATAATDAPEARTDAGAPTLLPAALTGLDSGTLLQGRTAVQIAHNGFVYTLQATRLGKLILTK